MFRSALLFGIVIAALSLMAFVIALPATGDASVSGDNTGQAQLTVTKSYDMACECDPPTNDIPVVVTCTLGATAESADGRPGTISNMHGAIFDITGAQLGTTCNVVESPVPPGFIQENSDCTNKPVPPEANATCHITNHQTFVFFQVAKVFTDSNPNPVSVTVTCSSGVTETNPQDVSESLSKNFYITGFNALGATCSATEVVPNGYEADLADCTDVMVSSGQEGAGCTITNNTLTPVVVGKNFQPDNPDGQALITLTCTGENESTGVEPPNSAIATEAIPAEFAVENADETTHCSASEAHIHGYTADASDCATIQPGRFTTDQLASPDCVINNNLNTATFFVNKSYPGLICPEGVVQGDGTFDPCNDSVKITLICTDGTVTPINDNATYFNSAQFTVSGFDPSPPPDAGPTCTATETVPPGYTGDNTLCQDVPLVLRDASASDVGAEGHVNSCTITNVLNVDHVTVFKDFTDNNQETVTIDLVCSSGEVTSSDQTAKDKDTLPPDAAHFTVTGFDTGATCVAHEDSIPEGYSEDNSDCNPITLSTLPNLSVQGEVPIVEESCTITNEPAAEPFLTPIVLPITQAPATQTPTPTPTPTPTNAPTNASTNSPTVSPSPTPTPTHAATASPTITPVIGPGTRSPTPAVSPTPFCHVVLTQPAEPGQTEVFISITATCDLGEWVTIDPGAADTEDGHVIGRGSLILECPVKLHHDAGEVVITIPGPVPGCAPATPAKLPNTGGPPTSSESHTLLLLGGLVLVLAAFVVAQRKAR